MRSVWGADDLVWDIVLDQHCEVARTVKRAANYLCVRQRSTAVVMALLSIPASAGLCAAGAQGVATGAMVGTIRYPDGRPAAQAHVRVTTGAGAAAYDVVARDGRFLVGGLDVGRMYTVLVTAVGALPERRDSLVLRLGEQRELEFVLRPIARSLDTVRTVASAVERANADGGTATTIADSLLHRLPTLNRNFLDFARLVPQVSTKIGLATGGLSGGGVLFRFNNYLIDGAPERFVSGNSSLAFGGGTSVPIDAVHEYQVLLAPYDVRYGDFAGVEVNTVTRSGANAFHGSVFADGRNDRLARGGPVAPDAPYERWQYGASASGPIVRDRAHLMVAAEWQRLTSPANGPHIGQSSTATPPVPVRAEDVERLATVMRTYGLDAGSGGAVENVNPLANLFSRFDLQLPRWNSRAVVSENFARSTMTNFVRPAVDSFPLSSYELIQLSWSQLASAQLHTNLRRAGGGTNTILVSYRAAEGRSRGPVDEPTVRVLVPSSVGGLAVVNMGTIPNAQRAFTREFATHATDNLTLPVGGAQLITIGGDAERFRLESGGVAGSYGTWTFSSVDSLALGVPERYELRQDFGSASVPVSGTQLAAVLGDRWEPSPRFQLTLGLRGDVLHFDGAPPYNPMVDSIFHRRTDRVPIARVELSPRVGFTLSRSQSENVRGGIGVFTGRPPVAWTAAAYTSYGVGIGALSCGALESPPPPFVPDHERPPQACAAGPEIAANRRGDVDLVDARLRMARTLRASVAYDRRMPGGVTSTTEALASRAISAFVFENINLVGPQGVDRHGRVLYGTIDAAGRAQPALRSPFAEVIDLRNTSRDRSFEISERVEKQFANGFGGMASYTYSRVRDAATPLRAGVRGTITWAGQRVLSGRDDDFTPTTSLYDIPHRIVLAGTYTTRGSHRPTTISFYYVGESGAPFTYVAFGARGLGDLNADGSNADDPIYIPRSTFDTSEIRFSGRADSAGADNSAAAQATRERAQQSTFEQLIQGHRCLRSQRGRIMRRNSCREPMSHTTVASVVQVMPIGSRALEIDLDAYNLLNLVNAHWGLYRVASPQLLEHVGQTSPTAASAQSIFRFNATSAGWTTVNSQSAFQLQVGVRYRF